MATNLTAGETDDNVIAPDEGEEVDAVTLGLGKGPIRRGMQALLNQIHRIRRGLVTIRGMHILAPGGAQVVAPTDGLLSVLGQIKVALFMVGQTSAILAQLGDIEAVTGNLIGVLLRLSGGSAGAPGPAVLPGDLDADMIPFARGHFNTANNTIRRAVNVASYTRTGFGRVSFTTHNCPPAFAGLPDNTICDATVIATPQVSTTTNYAAIRALTTKIAGPKLRVDLEIQKADGDPGTVLIAGEEPVINVVVWG